MTHQPDSQPPPLRARQIPFNLRSAIVHEDPRSLAQDFGSAVFLDFLALNMIAEFAETLLYYLHRVHRVMDGQAETRVFVEQELRHATALHIVNRWFVKDTYVQTEFGRLSRLCQAVRAPLLLELRAAHADETRRQDLLHRLSLEVAAFETTFGLLAQVPLFDLLEDNPDRFLRHPVFSYVTLYHAAEEAEHTHISWNHHRDTYGEDIFDATQKAQLVAVTERLFDEITRVTFLVARQIDHPLSLEEAQSSPPAQGRLRLLEKLASGVFHPAHYVGLRRACVESWDTVWEPQFRRAVENRLSSSAYL
jgi:hypothetical protein